MSNVVQLWDNIFGERIVNPYHLAPHRQQFMTDEYLVTGFFRIGAVDFLIFPILLTGLSFALTYFAFVFARTTAASFEIMSVCKCGPCGIFCLPFLVLGIAFGLVTTALCLGVLACFLVRVIASAALFLIALPFSLACGRSHDNYSPIASTYYSTTSIYPPLLPHYNTTLYTIGIS